MRSRWPVNDAHRRDSWLCAHLRVLRLRCNDKYAGGLLVAVAELRCDLSFKRAEGLEFSSGSFMWMES